MDGSFEVVAKFYEAVEGRETSFFCCYVPVTLLHYNTICVYVEEEAYERTELYFLAKAGE